MATAVLPQALHIRSRRAGLTELAARKFVECHGGDALSILGERAAIAAERGHRVAASAWRDLADVAAALLDAKALPHAGLPAAE